MQLQRLLYSDTGRNIISIVLGIGLAALFQKVCKDKDCVIFILSVMKSIYFFLFFCFLEKEVVGCFSLSVSNVKLYSTKFFSASSFCF